MNNYSPYGVEAEPLSRYIAKTFGWMFLGLATTFAVMLTSYLTGAVALMLSVPAMIALGLLEFGTVLVLSANIGKFSVGMSRGLFFFYAVLNGLVFSTYFLYFDVPILVLSFGITALYFGVMSAVGYFTKVNLSGLRPILIGGLILMIVFNFLGAAFGYGGMDRIFSFAGVALFLAFTAYDIQKIKESYTAMSNNPEMLAKSSIFGALQLYLDFVNLFLYILRLFSSRD